MNKGYVYVLSNPSMPGIVKVGFSMHGGSGRAESLYRNDTAVPTPFVLEFEVFVRDYKWIEKCVHKDMDGLRINPNREFFAATPVYAEVVIVKHVAASIALDKECHAQQIVLPDEEISSNSDVVELDPNSDPSEQWECIKSSVGFSDNALVLLDSCDFVDAGYSSLSLRISEELFRKHYSEMARASATDTLSTYYGRSFSIDIELENVGVVA